MYIGTKGWCGCCAILIVVLLGRYVIWGISSEKFVEDLPSSCATCSYHEFFLGESSVSSHPGHWPANYCKITNVYIRTTEKAFAVGVNNVSSIDLCFGTRQIWNFVAKSKDILLASNSILDQVPFFCDQIFETGHIFTLYYHHGSNYFHLHYDAALPIYYLLHHNATKDGSQQTSKNTIFMPSVEITRGQGINWDTNAFMNESTYWNALLRVLVEPYRLLPLDERLAAMDKTLCFKEVYFGTPKFFTGSDVIKGFGRLIKSRLHIQSSISTSSSIKRRVGLIHRVGRRKILNEAQLISAIKPYADVELVDFAALSFTKQVDIVQRYNILIGMNGAGLINALYLPLKSVAVQLVPYKAQLNYSEYKRLLKARGPYLDWYNTHSNLSQSVPGDAFNNSADTYVQVNEFVALLHEALKLCNQ